MSRKGISNKWIYRFLLLIMCVSMAAFFSACLEDSSSATYTVTFVQEGKDDIVKSVKAGESLTDIPEPVSETGYTIVWDRTDFSSVTENITVTAIKTANVYTITYDLGVNKYATLSEKTQSVTYGLEYTLKTPEYEGSAKFQGWYIADENGKATNEKAENGKYLRGQDVTLIAVWQEWSDIVN